MPRREISPSPLRRSNGTVVEVGLPSTLTIDLVQGAELRHYELFLSLSSLSLSVAVGFWTGFITDAVRPVSLLWSAVAFSGLAVYCGIIAFIQRSKIFNGRIKAVAGLNQFKPKT